MPIVSIIRSVLIAAGVMLVSIGVHNHIGYLVITGCVCLGLFNGLIQD